jgi:hypothetical protein
MMFDKPARAIALTLLLLAGAASCAAPAPPPAPQFVPPPLPPEPPAPPPPPARVGLSHQIIELAQTYRTTMAAQASIQPVWTNGQDVAQAVKIGASYEQTQLQEGAIAYAALMATQEPTFVASVRRYVVDPEATRELIARLTADPTYVSSFEGADRAAGLAIDALDGMGAKVMVAGRAVKQSAYDVQRQAWSRTNVQNAAERLTGAKDLSTRRLIANAAEVAEMRRASAGEAAISVSGAPVPAPWSPVVTRGVALAALAALGGADDSAHAQVAAILKDDETSFCLNMAKLNLYQCLAVAGPHYEDVFCLGQHAMMDTGQCMIKAANSPTPAFVPPPPPPPAVIAQPKTKGRSR